MVLEEYFVTPDYMDDEEDGEKVFSEEDKQIILKVVQKKAAEKQRRRVGMLGELLRSKGFVLFGLQRATISWEDGSKREMLSGLRLNLHGCVTWRICGKIILRLQSMLPRT